MPRRFHWLIFTAIALGTLTVQTVKAQEPSWSRVFDDYYISSIETTNTGILAGQFDTRVWLYPYNGIYISKDLGKTWELFGLEGKGVTHVKYSTDIYATTYYHTNTPPGLYRSTDSGKTWEHISPPYSANYVEVIDDILFLGTEAYGLLVSFDKGITWEDKISNIRIEQIRKTGNTFIASASNKTYQSEDNGKTWNRIVHNRLYPTEIYEEYIYEIKPDDVYQNTLKTNLNLIGQDLALTYTLPPYLFVSVNGTGIYRYEIPQIVPDKYPLLITPWENKDNNEFVDNITAYFDHEYPLLGYPYHQENTDVKNTTVNFWGMREEEPELYYSSHNGTDYSLSYGDNILAAAPGIARYYWCAECGNTIDIDHQNGYHTIYMHLQDTPKTISLNNTYVTQGEVIGKVGMTGNTTGPHLHFMVKKGGAVIDPYGWENNEYKDPWETYSWVDSTGSHIGIKSPYLWKQEINKKSELISETNKTIENDQKKVTFTNTNTLYTVLLRNYIKPGKVPTLLSYIKNTSILIEAIDLLGNKVKQLPNAANITFDISDLDLSSVILTTLKIYHFNSELKIWEPLETTIDIGNNTISAETNSFSHFALFGETKYSNLHFLDTAKEMGGTFSIGHW